MRNRFLTLLFIGPVLALLLLSVLWFTLVPVALERFILPRVAEIAHIPYLRAEVRKFDLTGLDLGNLSLGLDPEHIAVSADSIRIDFRPMALLKKRIAKITIGAPQINLRNEGGKFSLVGVTLPTTSDNGGGGPMDHLIGPGRGVELPCSLGEVEVVEGVVVVQNANQPRRFPFSLHASFRQPLPDTVVEAFDGGIDLFLGDDLLSTIFTVDFSKNSLQLSLSGRSVSVSGLAGYIRDLSNIDLSGIDLSGQVEIEAKGEMSLSPFAVLKGQSNVVGHGLRISNENVTLVGRNEGSDGGQLLHLEGGGEAWMVTMPGVEVLAPVFMQISALQSKIKLEPERIAAEGALQLELSALPAGHSGLELGIPIALPIGFSCSLDHQEQWRCAIKNQLVKEQTTVPGPVRVSREGMHLAMPLPTLDISGAGTRHQGSVAYSMRLPQVDFEAGGATVSAGQVEVTGTGSVRFGGQEGHPPGGDENAPLRLDAELAIKDGQIEVPEHGVKAEGLSAKIPISWPLSPQASEGQVKVRAISLHSQKLGSLTLRVQPGVDSIDLVGRHESTYIAGLVVDINGHLGSFADRNAVDSLSVTVPEFQFDHVTPKVLLPESPDLVLAGKLASHADFTVSHGQLQGTMDLVLENGLLQMPEKDLSVAGLGVTLHFSDLMAVRSAPGVLQFSSMTIGKRTIGQGTVSFQVESMDSLLVEKSSFDWCRGRVHTNALRIQAGKKEYQGILYADGLRLADVLGQFALEDAEGEGTVNGRIPFRLENGRLRLERGFLFSTPGDGGILHVGATDLLLAGVPERSPQFYQLDFAGEALKNFEYKWAKVYLVSEGEDMVLQIQLDGSPTKPLPFTFSPELGAFTRTSVSGSAGIMQPIRLDVNLRVPFDTMLGYGNDMKKIWDKL